LRLVAASSTPSPKPSGHRRKLSDASACANMATGEGSDKGEAERGRAVTFRDRRGWREQRGGAEEQQREERPHWETAAVAVANGGGGAGVEWKWVCVQTDGVGKRKGGVVGEGRQGTGCQPATRRHPPRCSFFSLCRAGRTRRFPRSFQLAGFPGRARSRARALQLHGDARAATWRGPARGPCCGNQHQRVIGARAPPSFPRDSSGAIALLHCLRATTMFLRLPSSMAGACERQPDIQAFCVTAGILLDRSELQHKPARLPGEAGLLFDRRQRCTLNSPVRRI
jgi:hypothetical protein